MVKATIHGPDQASQCDTVRLSCQISGSEYVGIIWQVEVSGRENIEADIIDDEKVEESGDAEIQIKINSDSGIRKIRIQCIAQIENLGEITSDTHQIEVISLQEEISLVDNDIKGQYETVGTNKHNFTKLHTESTVNNSLEACPSETKEDTESTKDENIFLKKVPRPGNHLERAFSKTQHRSSPNSSNQSFVAKTFSFLLTPSLSIISIIIANMAK